MFKIFRKLGGEEAALEIIAEKTGKRPAAFLVRKWRSIGRIPAIKAVILLDECRRRRISATYEDDCEARGAAQ